MSDVPCDNGPRLAKGFSTRIPEVSLKKIIERKMGLKCDLPSELVLSGCKDLVDVSALDGRDDLESLLKPITE